MIFYFTGTGNSKYAATAIREKGETLVDIGALYKEGNYDIEVPTDERVGLVFPVYYGGLPIPVQRFLDNWKPTGQPEFLFSVITCGAATFACSDMLEDRLAEKNLKLDSVFAVVMPDNYVVMYELPEDYKQRGTLKAAEGRLEEIKRDLQEKKEMGLKIEGRETRATKMMYMLYKKGKKTKKFYVDDTCKGCGLCVERCVDKAIELKDGKPVWVRERCTHCMSCMRCNAIQYGGRTVGRKRWAHPILQPQKQNGKK